MSTAKAATVIDDTIAERIMAAIAHGMTIRQFIGGTIGGEYVADARLATRRAFKLYVEANPIWARDMRRALHTAQQANNVLKGAHQRNKTHCPHGHRYANKKENATRRHCKRCNTIQQKKAYHARKHDPQFIEPIRQRRNRRDALISNDASLRAKRATQERERYAQKKKARALREAFAASIREARANGHLSAHKRSDIERA